MFWITFSLVLVGILFMLAEFLLIPGVGVAGFLSLGAFGTAVWYSFEHLGPVAGWWTFSVVLVLLIVTVVVALRGKTWRKLGLKTEVKSTVADEIAPLAIGARGTAKTRLAPMGTGEFELRSYEVKSYDNSMIDAGSSIEVVLIEDNKIIVKKI